MSDVEENNFEGRESRSQSKSPAGSPARVKSESRSGSRSPSRASKHSESHSRSRSKSRSRSRRHSHRRYTRSRSHSHSHSHRRRSRSRSYTPEYRRRRSRSHSPMSNRRRHTGSRANPDPNTCLGVFGLSLYTTERDLREVFSRYGPLTGVNVVYDQRTGRSRGFAFVYFERIDDSKELVEETLQVLLVVSKGTLDIPEKNTRRSQMFGIASYGLLETLKYREIAKTCRNISSLLILLL
ncbi:transformer-2 protein homolog alpha isoform 1-T1 [Podargus strigoides]